MHGKPFLKFGVIEANESLKLKRICSQCAKTRQAEKAEKRKRLVAQLAKTNAVVYEAFEAFGVPSIEPQATTGAIEPMCPVRSSSFVTKVYHVFFFRFCVLCLFVCV